MLLFTLFYLKACVRGSYEDVKYYIDCGHANDRDINNNTPLILGK